MNISKRLLNHSLVAAILCTTTALAGVPSAERLLPEDTLVLVTAPDFAKLSQVTGKSREAQLWNDPAMKPFKEKFLTKWNEDLVKPLEREWDIKIADYTALLQGQVTLAITRNGWKGHDDEEPGVLVLVDAKDKSDQLKKNLAGLRKKWVAAGKTLKTEKIRDVEFQVLPLSSNDVPKTIRNLFPKSAEADQSSGDEKPGQKGSKKDELVIGQVDSLLVVANNLKAAEAVVARAGRGSAPVLADFGPYQANHQALFRDTPLYAWINVKAFMNILLPVWSEKKEESDSPNPMDVAPEKILNALGLSALKTIAATVRKSNEGTLLELFFTVPEASRQGLFKILAGEAKESNPPPFVPADAVKFQRWRIDGRKAWATLQQVLADISPQAVNTLNFVLDSANTYAKEKDSGFDIRKNLIGNLGDDIISIEKRPRSESGDAATSGPSLVLVGSPNPEEFVAALKSILVFMNQQAGPQEREFLGRKIYSVPISLPGRPAPASGKPPVLNYGASGGYVALSTDAAMVEEYFRIHEGSQPKPLRELPGLSEAAQKVTGPGSSLFGYENDVEGMRTAIELLRKTFGSDKNSGSTAGVLPIMVSLGGAGKVFKEWFDFSLLPSFDKMSKYFNFSVYGGSATVDGLTFKMFTPVPPGLKSGQGS
jgi:hypothetical protein